MNDNAEPSIATSGRNQANSPDLRIFIFALFFIFGGITSLNDIIIPKLKELFTLTYGRALFVQSAFFFAYFIFSLPSAAVVRKFGYMKTAALGLVVMMAGCLLFVPASYSGRFGVFLAALFILAAGITVVQVVANPLISLLGPAETAASRLTFAQAFNSLGTTIFPYVGSILILGSLSHVDPKTLSGIARITYTTAETKAVVHTYLGLAIALLVVAIAVWSRRNRLKEELAEHHSMFAALGLLKRPRFAFGTLCIFLYVGAEVAIGSLIVSYLMQADVMGATAEAAGKHVPLYWGGALLGRFAGSGLLRIAPPGRVLAGVASGAIILILVSANSVGAVSAWSLLAIGLMNSIMFPTIFSLASLGLGKEAAAGSGVLATAIVGGAIIPPLTGYFADQAGLHVAIGLPAICYVVIALFGLYAASDRGLRTIDVR